MRRLLWILMLGFLLGPAARANVLTPAEPGSPAGRRLNSTVVAEASRDLEDRIDVEKNAPPRDGAVSVTLEY